MIELESVSGPFRRGQDGVFREVRLKSDAVVELARRHGLRVVNVRRPNRKLELVGLPTGGGPR